jgi:outer membrane protein assembly factor BamB
LVAGRDGHLYVLDGMTGEQLQTLNVSDQPLAMSPTISIWQNDQNTIITALIRPGNPNRLANTLPNLVGMSLRLDNSVPLWRTDLGSGWSPHILPFRIEGHPNVFLSTDKNWQIVNLATGAVRSTGVLAAPLVSGVAVADIEENGKPYLVFQFADTSQQMIAVNPSDGTVVWRGPADLNPRGQPRGDGGTLPRTSTGAFLVSTQDALAAVDPRSGHIIWRAVGVPRGVLLGDWDNDGKNEILVTISGIGLRCLDEAGRELWTLRFSEDVNPWRLVESPDGGPRDILIHRHAGLIRLVHGPTLLWQSNASAAIQATPIVAQDSRGNSAVIEDAPWGGDVYLRAFDGASGKVLWSAKEQLSPNRGAALADIDGIGQPYVVALGSRPPDPNVYLLIYRPMDGKIIREKRVALSTWLSCVPAVADFRGIGKSDVAFSTWDDRSIVMVDGRSGDILWRFPVGASTMSGVASADLDGDGLADVIAATLDGNVYALRGKDRSLLWKTLIPGGAWASPKVATLDANTPPYILITSLSGALYVLNSRTGETVWSFPVSTTQADERVTMNVPRVSGNAVVVSDDGRTVIIAPMGAAGVVAFDWTSKSELWRSPSGFPVTTTPVPVTLTRRAGKGVLVAAVTGDIWMLSLDGGKPLWHMATGVKAIEADPVVADVDGDGVPDILIAGYDFSLRVISGIGRSIARQSIGNER